VTGHAVDKIQAYHENHDSQPSQHLIEAELSLLHFKLFSGFSWGGLPDSLLEIGSCLQHSIIHPFFSFLEETLAVPHISALVIGIFLQTTFRSGIFSAAPCGKSINYSNIPI
jgi:hypothetical protein